MKPFWEVAIQHFCGFAIDHVWEGAVCQVMYLFSLGVRILDRNVQWPHPFLCKTYASRGSVNTCFQILLLDLNLQWQLFYVCLVSCNSVQVATHKALYLAICLTKHLRITNSSVKHYMTMIVIMQCTRNSQLTEDENKRHENKKGSCGRK